MVRTRPPLNPPQTATLHGHRVYLTSAYERTANEKLKKNKKIQASKITDWVLPNDKSGEFKRQASVFRDWLSTEPGARFPPEKGRYHLYVSYACPWVRGQT